MVLQPNTAGLVDPDPLRPNAGDVRDEKLVIGCDVGYKFVADLGRRFVRSHDPNCLEMMPPST